MSLLQRRRTWVAAGLAAALIVVGLSWLMLISPLRTDTAALRTQLAQSQQQNTSLGRRLSTLKAKHDDIATLRAALRTAAAGLPHDSGLPAFTRQVAQQAKASGVTVGSIAVGAVTSVAQNGGAGATGTSPSAAGSAPATPSAGSTGAGSAPSAAVGQLFAIPVTITTTGSAHAQFAFLRSLRQTGSRTALVTSTQFGPGTGAVVASIDGGSTMTTVLTVFSAPLSPEGQAQLDALIAGSGAS